MCVCVYVLYFNETGVNEEIEDNTLFVCSADNFFALITVCLSKWIHNGNLPPLHYTLLLAFRNNVVPGTVVTLTDLFITSLDF